MRRHIVRNRQAGDERDERSGKQQPDRSRRLAATRSTKAVTQPHSVPFTSNAAALTNARRTLTEPPISGGETKSPNDLFMRQVGRTLTAADEGVLVGHRMLICDRDAKWSAPVRERLGEAGIRVVQTRTRKPIRLFGSPERHYGLVVDPRSQRRTPAHSGSGAFGILVSSETHVRALRRFHTTR